MTKSQNSQGKSWFRARKSWFGPTPCSWQGVISIIIYIISVISVSIAFDMDSHSVSDSLISISPIFISLTCILIILSYFTSEKSD